MSMDAAQPQPGMGATDDVHYKLGLLTRQLHNALTELGYADQLRGTMSELPDAQSRLSYIARLTGDAAEKVLSRVEMAKAQNDRLIDETARVRKALVADPVATVAKGEIYNFLTDLESISKETDNHLIEIMMAQDFHDLTGQVIARVVTLAATIEQQLVQLLIQTAPPVSGATADGSAVNAELLAAAGGAVQETIIPADPKPLQGPVVDPEARTDVVTSQSQVDDLLASLGF